MIQKLNWEAFSSQDRNVVINQVKATISKYESYIVNFNMFSDLAISLLIEIEEQDIEHLHKALSKVVSLSELERNNFKPSSQKAWYVFMNISFTKGKGDMKNDIPDVPG